MSIPFADNRIGSRRALPQRSADGHTAEHPVNMPRTLRCRFHMFHILLFPVSQPCVCGEKFVDLLSTDISLHDDPSSTDTNKTRVNTGFPRRFSGNTTCSVSTGIAAVASSCSA